jgi:hypothetical protein
MTQAKRDACFVVHDGKTAEKRTSKQSFWNIQQFEKFMHGSNHIYGSIGPQSSQRDMAAHTAQPFSRILSTVFGNF